MTSDEEDKEQSAAEESAAEESGAEEPMYLEHNDEATTATAIINDAEDEAESAAVMARTLVDLEPLKDKVSKCRCTLFIGQHCIDQFTNAESDEIRYRIIWNTSLFNCM